MLTFVRRVAGVRKASSLLAVDVAEDAEVDVERRAAAAVARAAGEVDVFCDGVAVVAGDDAVHVLVCEGGRQACGDAECEDGGGGWEMHGCLLFSVYMIKLQGLVGLLFLERFFVGSMWLECG
jgi:hypothetical protein